MKLFPSRDFVIVSRVIVQFAGYVMLVRLIRKINQNFNLTPVAQLLVPHYEMLPGLK